MPLTDEQVAARMAEVRKERDASRDLRAMIRRVLREELEQVVISIGETRIKAAIDVIPDRDPSTLLEIDGRHAPRT